MKTNLTNTAHQSQVLPLIESAETEIKKLINYYALFLKPKRELNDKINGTIRAVNERLPISLFERYKYILGLRETADKMIRDYYDPVVRNYHIIIAALVLVGIKAPKNPLELNKQLQTKSVVRAIESHKKEIDTWSMAKGYPNVLNYPQELKKKMNGLAKTQTVASETGKKPITVWQKAELDLRYEGQVDMIKDLVNNGVQYAWTSTHPDCSKRCEKWQGKLFDLQAPHSEMSGHRMKDKVDGHTVYCFKEVISQVDKYGYQNNIIVGFNCRHRLIPYKPGSVAPQEFTKEQVRRNREINETLRRLEREIRYYKQQSILYNSIDKRLAEKYKLKAKELTETYKNFADKNGYAWYQWRITV